MVKKNILLILIFSFANFLIFPVNKRLNRLEKEVTEQQRIIDQQRQQDGIRRQRIMQLTSENDALSKKHLLCCCGLLLCTCAHIYLNSQSSQIADLKNQLDDQRRLTHNCTIQRDAFFEKLRKKEKLD